MALLLVENLIALFLIYWLSKAVCRQHFNTLVWLFLFLLANTRILPVLFKKMRLFVTNFFSFPQPIILLKQTDWVTRLRGTQQPNSTTLDEMFTSTKSQFSKNVVLTQRSSRHALKCVIFLVFPCLAFRYRVNIRDGPHAYHCLPKMLQLYNFVFYSKQNIIFF